MSPYANSAQALRRMRQRIFSYSSKREAQADRVLAYLNGTRDLCLASARTAG